MNDTKQNYCTQIKMNVHNILKESKKKAKEVALSSTKNTEDHKLNPHCNYCPRCGYNMGMYWASQYCSRKCVYGFATDSDDETK